MNARAVAGIVLAGGAGRRFGGNKPNALLSGRPLVAWVVAAMREVCDDVVVVVAPGQALPAIEGVRVVVDRWPGEGPLGGLVTGLEACTADVCLVSGCDTPLVRPGLLRLLAERMGEADAVVPLVGGEPQVLVAAYRRETALRELGASFEAGERSVRRAVSRLAVVSPGDEEMAAVDGEMVSFRGANTVGELAALEAVANALTDRV